MSHLLHFEEVDSTNTYLKTHRADLSHATVVYAAKKPIVHLTAGLAVFAHFPRARHSV